MTRLPDPPLHYTIILISWQIWKIGTCSVDVYDMAAQTHITYFNIPIPLEQCYSYQSLYSSFQSR